VDEDVDGRGVGILVDIFGEGGWVGGLGVWSGMVDVSESRVGAGDEVCLLI
jgi:hypothetical protein